MTDHSLATTRAAIDRIDQQLLQLFNERAKLAQHIGHTKKADDPKTPLYRPEREAQILRALPMHNPGPLRNDTIRLLFRELMSGCLALEQPLTIAFLGPAGTYTEVAVQKHFGHAVHTQPQAEIASIFAAVTAGDADYGVVPIENSTQGMVGHTLDCLSQTHAIQICGEVTLRIQHQLLGQPIPLHQIKAVYAHQQALAQCQRWLALNLPQAKHITVSSNGEAARLTAEHPGTAAIAGEQAAQAYQLQKLASNIQDFANNSTRFIVLGAHAPAPSGQDKTSILLSSDHQPGSLHRLLEPLATHHINMSRIESRPAPHTQWHYVFFIDLLGHHTDPEVQNALHTIQTRAQKYRLLGSYPQGI